MKVKLSLPDEGLTIDNILDPEQSWMYKTSELLYFWRDFYYVNIIVIITTNRLSYYSTEPYSASIFRLRGNESVQLFVQRAQQFFAQLSASNSQRNNSEILFEKSATAENFINSDHKKKHNRRSKHHSKTHKKSVSNTTIDHPVTRTEFDPKKKTTINSYKDRTYSETTSSSDTISLNSKKQNNNNDDDDKITSVSSNFPNESVAELLRELKELRSEIAALKINTRFTPTRSISTSPLFDSSENTKHRMYSSPSEIDAETQTDLSMFNDEGKMDILNEISVTNKRKNEQFNTNINKRTVLNGLNNIESDREGKLMLNLSSTNISFLEITLTNSSRINGSSSSLYTEAEFQPLTHSTRSDFNFNIQQNGLTISNSNFVENDSFLPIRPVVIEKEIPKVLSTNISSSTPMNNTGEVVSFRTSLEDTIDPPENIYENIPILIQMNSEKNFSITDKNDQEKEKKPYLYVNIADDNDSELQKQYLSQLFGPQNGISLLLPQESIQNNVIQNNKQYFHQALFSNHLTNPLFNVDKQLLANTIANQFGIDRKSPYLQKLIANQHLFVTRKRTFANMIWQITPEEENALCSSPETTKTNIIDTNTVDANSSTAKSILKPKKRSRSVSKGQRISWDSTLE